MKMPIPPHLQIINPNPADQVAVSKFTLFSQLPPEIRVKIWKASLQRERIIRLRLISSHLMELLIAQEDDTTKPADMHKGYCAIAVGCQLFSKLLRVNSEARQAALAFYRIHLPARLTSHARETPATWMPGTLHINPEFDILRIDQDTPELVGLLHDLKTTYDPRGIGLLNLAVDINGLNGCCGLHEIESLTHSPATVTSFVETLAQLRAVYFVSDVHAGRQPVQQWCWPESDNPTFNRSFPISAMGAPFERIACDPRAVARDLKRVFACQDPKDMLQSWLRLLEKWGVPTDQVVEYRFLLTFIPGHGKQVYDRRDAQEFLRREDEMWQGTNRDKYIGPFSNLFKKQPAGADIFGDDLENAVKPAFGFWLFPINKNGVPINGHVLDLSEYSPELGLQILA